MQVNTIVKISISRSVARQLRAAIVTAQFRIGQRLPAGDEHAQRDGVSRQPESGQRLVVGAQ